MKKIKLFALLSIVIALICTSCTNADDEVTVVSNQTATGMQSAPFGVSDAYGNQGLSKYVSGYIVGYIWYNSKFSYTFNSDTCTQKVNVLIADSKDETNPEKCLSVELPAGTIRDSLNLATNKKRLGHKVNLFGTIEFYYGKTGVRNTSYFIDGKDSIGVKPINPIYSEKFLLNLGQFTSVTASGDEKWYWTTYKYAMVTGYISSVNKADECWMISPSIDLTKVPSPKMSFDHVTRYFNTPASDATVWISEDYVSGMPSTATWKQIPTSFTNASSWTFATSGEISLAAYSGKKVKVAFKYLSTATKAGTWELKNFLIYER
ncbi:MAG: DUF6359 domain-containing protein [Bacteroidales bacterium]